MCIPILIPTGELLFLGANLDLGLSLYMKWYAAPAPPNTSNKITVVQQQHSKIPIRPADDPDELFLSHTLSVLSTPCSFYSGV